MPGLDEYFSESSRRATNASIKSGLIRNQHLNRIALLLVPQPPPPLQRQQAANTSSSSSSSRRMLKISHKEVIIKFATTGNNNSNAGARRVPFSNCSKPDRCCWKSVSNDHQLLHNCRRSVLSKQKKGERIAQHRKPVLYVATSGHTQLCERIRSCKLKLK
jgi:hypothetical protein